MKYLMMIYGNTEKWSSLPQEEWKALTEKVDAYSRPLLESGEMLSGFGLADADRARVVRSRPGGTIVTDGPYLETKEYMASGYLLDVASEARALEIAATHPYAAEESIELWPIEHEARA
ncbi:YciI family protein [Actinocorallia longicatena]|uniref:YciI family protein n=1 Tax=Actinocorallia longicatena TaxID=111803 RepID=A0ABP6QGX5_9ACTN